MHRLSGWPEALLGGIWGADHFVETASRHATVARLKPSSGKRPFEPLEGRPRPCAGRLALRTVGTIRVDA